MILKRTTLFYFFIWLCVVALISANVSYYSLGRIHAKQYLEKVAAAEKVQTLELSDLIKSASSQPPSRATILPEITSEEQKTINYLNSGNSATDASLSLGNNCASHERPWRRFTDSSTCAFVLKNAVGDLKLLVVEFASPDLDLSDPKVNEYITKVNSKNTIEHFGYDDQPTIAYLKTYFEAEAKVFNVPNFSLQVDTTPVIKLASYPPYEAKTRAEQLGEIGKSRTFFLDELRKANVDVRDYDAVAIVVLSPSWGEFVSFALSGIRADVTKFNVNNSSFNYDVATLAHEFTHDLGASDQYYEEGGCEPQAQDEYTGNGKLSLMCTLSSLNLNAENRVVINKLTAKELGWLPY